MDPSSASSPQDHASGAAPAESVSVRAAGGKRRAEDMCAEASDAASVPLPNVFLFRDFELAKLACKPKTSKGQYAFAQSYDGKDSFLFQFAPGKCCYDGLSKYDPSKAKKGGAGEDAASAKVAAPPKEEDESNALNLEITCTGTNLASARKIEAELPEYIMKDKPLLESLFGAQSGLSEDDRTTARDIRKIMNKIVKEGKVRMEKNDKTKPQMVNGEPAKWPDTMSFKVDVKNGKPCCQIFDADKQPVYEWYAEDAKNQQVKMALIAALDQRGYAEGSKEYAEAVRKYEESHPNDFIVRKSMRVVAKLSGIYFAGKAVGVKFRVEQIFLQPDSPERASVPAGVPLLRNDDE